MSLDIKELLVDVGIKPPKELGAIEVPSRCALYMHSQILAAPVSVAPDFFKEEAKAVVCFIGIRDYVCSDHKDAIEISRMLSAFCDARKISVRTSISESMIVALAPWSHRYQFHSSIIEFLESDSFRSSIWPIMERDFLLDERQLKMVRDGARAGFLLALTSTFAKPERAWAFSHFNLTQKRTQTGFLWVIDVGSDLHLIDGVERIWKRQKASGGITSVEMISSAAQSAVDGGPTWIAESLEFQSVDFSKRAVYEFCEYLRVFVNSLYLIAVDDVPASSPEEMFSVGVALP